MLPAVGFPFFRPFFFVFPWSLTKLIPFFFSVRPAGVLDVSTMMNTVAGAMNFVGRRTLWLRGFCMKILSKSYIHPTPYVELYVVINANKETTVNALKMGPRAPQGNLFLRAQGFIAQYYIISGPGPGAPSVNGYLQFRATTGVRRYA
jgi:hypothetical protein